MKDRTFLILQALIQDFIETAEPIASGKLLQTHNLSISSATIRNEFAILEEVGLITSPYISSGKIPTQKGYRKYVDQLQENPKEEKQITTLFEKYIQEYHLSKSKESLFDALRVIAQLSGNVAFATIFNDKTSYIGLSNVLRAPEFTAEPEKAARIVEILEGKARFQSFIQTLDTTQDEVKIFIGEENLLDEIQSCAMVVTGIETNHLQGAIGILGPMRMKYGYNKALLKSAAQMII